MAGSTDCILEAMKMKNLHSRLSEYSSHDTCLITMTIPPNHLISKATALLTKELGTAANIKSESNRAAVKDAIKKLRVRLESYSQTPKNGLVLFSGTVSSEETGHKKTLVESVTPPKEVLSSIYTCGKRFDTSVLEEKEPDFSETHGFVVINGESAIFGLQKGVRLQTLWKTSVDLPKKHRRGGQSALRFDRQREEKRHNFLRKVTDSAKTHFLQNNLPNCAGLILAGTANLKNELKNLLDPRLQKIVLKVVDTSYGGEAGFKEAVRASADLLSATRFGREKKVLENFFQKLARESEGVCYGIENVATALENGALDTLIIHEAFDTICEKNGTSSDKNFQWFADRHALFKTKIEIITGMSGECVQFVNGFCGIGGLTRYNWDHDYSDSAEDGSD